MALCLSAAFNKGKQYADQEPLFAGWGLGICEAAIEYQPRHPEESVLYRVVAENLESFLMFQQERGRVLPRFVENDLRDFLDCGILERGFIRVRCDACGKDRVVAFSCKSRSFCPSCYGRRMAETAAHLVDHVFPEVPVRQWVLSVPYSLRYRLAYDSSLVRDVAQIFVRAIFSSIRRRAGIRASNRKARCGTVGFIQRFSDALNLDPHFHMMALDGFYLENSKSELAFLPAGLPSDAEVVRVASRVHRSVMHLMKKRGIGPGADAQDTLQLDEPLLAELYSASISGRAATGPRAGRPIVRVGNEVESKNAEAKAGSSCAMVEGFSVHAGVSVPARDRLRLERLLRYASRGPISNERLSLLPNGRVRYKLKRRWKDGTKAVIYEPMELMERLAALVPPPRFNTVRYYGVLAPASSLRRYIVPQDKSEIGPAHPGCLAKAEASSTEASEAKPKPSKKSKNYSWAQLLKRVFEVDILICPRCGSKIRILCAIHQHDAIQKILTCLGLPSRAPPIAPAKPVVVEDRLFW
jgi:hypothetical protein